MGLGIALNLFLSRINRVKRLTNRREPPMADLLTQGLRPFFLAAALLAAGAVPLWTLAAWRLES